MLFSDSKFAILSVISVRTNLGATPFRLADGTQVFDVLPLGLPSHWQEWIGSVQAGHLKSCNLALMCQTDEGDLEIADEALNNLGYTLCGLYTMLRLRGTIEYQDAYLIEGYFRNGEAIIQRFSNLDRLHVTKGYQPWTIRTEDLEEAAKLHRARASTKLIPANTRFRRGLNELIIALQKYHGGDRLHGFVRSIEALILPDKGQTRKQFVNRCLLLTSLKNHAAARKVLEETYDMRSDVEHMHEWDRSLSQYSVAEREDVALHRTRQMEALSCAGYRRILSDANMQCHFSDDAAISSFWAQRPADIRSLCGTICDVTSI